MSSCGQQVKLRTTLITKHTTAALNTPPWLQCTWVGNINKDTDEEERNTGGCWPPATHTALSPDTPRRLCRAASRRQLQSSDDSDKGRYRTGYHCRSSHGRPRIKSKTHRGQLEEDHRMADARVQQQRMSIPLVVKAGGVGALRMGAGHSSGTQ